MKDNLEYSGSHLSEPQDESASRLILFDIDGTLLISRGIGREAKRRAMLEHFGAVGDLDNHVFGGKTDWQILADLLAPYGKSAADIGKEMPVYERVMARHMGEIRADYHAEAVPHAMELVSTLLKRNDSVVGLVTGNTSKTAAIKLEMAGYDPDWFVIGAFGNEAAERDDLTRLAVERAGAVTGSCFAGRDVIVIGDTAADIQAARAIDGVAVAVCTGYTPRDHLVGCKPDYLLEDLGAFLETVMV